MTLDDLTPRERDVVREIADGRSYGAIATKLAISRRTVESHADTIANKLKSAGIGASHFRPYRRIERWAISCATVAA